MRYGEADVRDRHDYKILKRIEEYLDKESMGVKDVCVYKKMQTKSKSGKIQALDEVPGCTTQRPIYTTIHNRAIHSVAGKPSLTRPTYLVGYQGVRCQRLSSCCHVETSAAKTLC